MKVIKNLTNTGLVIFLMSNLLLSSCSFSKKTFKNTAEEAPSHALWDSLLKVHVKPSGMVDYQGFIKDSVILNDYLSALSNSAPDPKKWSENERLAYWINAYNAFTIQIVIRHYPIDGIKDIASGLNIPFVSTTWDIKFITIGGEKINLNRIEHGIIRKEFDEPRIHFAVNCASISCPVLLDEAYVADKLDDQLDKQSQQFINDSSRNDVKSAQEASVSKLFTWFSGDFKDEDRTVVDFINQYSKVKLNKDASLSYLDYDWSLNDHVE